MGRRNALRLIVSLLRREPGVSAAQAIAAVARAEVRAGLGHRRYFDDFDIESLLYQVSLEGAALARAARSISRARAGDAYQARAA